MEQVQMAYWEMDTWKVTEFNFFNENVEKFTSRWSQNLVNVRNPSNLKQYIYIYIYIYILTKVTVDPHSVKRIITIHINNCGI